MLLVGSTGFLISQSTCSYAGSGVRAMTVANPADTTNVNLNGSGLVRYLSFMHVTPDQIRAARVLLHLDQTEVARRARVSVVTIRRLEATRSGGRVAGSTLDGVRQVLEHAGAEFITDGVRRRPSARPNAAALFEELRAISLRSAERLQGREVLTEADLYDEDGLPA